jgi:hypothetical protein
MFDVITTIKALKLSVSNLTTQVATINNTVATLSGGGNLSPNFTNVVSFASASGTFSFDTGNGNGASYTTYDSKITLPLGTAFFGQDGTIKGYINSDYGYIDMKAGFRVNGVNVLTSGDFRPSDYAPLAGATFNGAVTVPTLTVTGAVQAGSAVFSSVTTPGTVTAASAVITGGISASSLALGQSLTATSATLTGTLGVSGATSLAGTSMTDAIVSASGTGGLHLVSGDSSHTGYIEFTKAGGSTRAGLVGNATTAGVILLSAEVNGGYFDFVTSNGAVDPKVNGNTIWHSGNFTPSTSDLSAYLLKGAAVLTGPFDASGNPIANVASFTTLNGTGTASIFSDSNTNDLVVRTGPSSGYFSTVFGADGSVRVPGALVVTAGGATITGATSITGNITVTGSATVNGGAVVVGDITTHQNSAVGTLHLGNAGNRSVGFDGTYYQMPGAELHVNGYKAWTSGDFQPSSFVNLYQTYYWSTASQPILTLASSSASLGAQASANAGGLTVMSPDTTSSTSAYMCFLNQSRFGINFGLDTNNNLAVGGWSFGNNSYKIFHQGNISPLQAVRMVFITDMLGPDIESVAQSQNNGNYNGMAEPFPGAVITGASANEGFWHLLQGVRFRYLQVMDQYGNWTTVSYV